MLPHGNFGIETPIEWYCSLCLPHEGRVIAPFWRQIHTMHRRVKRTPYIFLSVGEYLNGLTLTGYLHHFPPSPLTFGAHLTRTSLDLSWSLARPFPSYPVSVQLLNLWLHVSNCQLQCACSMPNSTLLACARFLLKLSNSTHPFRV